MALMFSGTMPVIKTGRVVFRTYLADSKPAIEITLPDNAGQHVVSLTRDMARLLGQALTSLADLKDI